MGLISKTAIVKWVGKTKKHYVDKGYKFTKMGDEFEVKVEDLTNGSRAMVECMCDNCKNIMIMKYSNYNLYKKDNDKYYCRRCGYKLFSKINQRNTILKNSKSIKQWCIENNRLDVLDRWDYELNEYSPDEISYGTGELYWFKCDKHLEHKSELKRIGNILRRGDDIKCNQCNSIAQWFIDNDLDINDYWDWDKNKDIDIWNIAHANNNEVIWMKCKNTHHHGSYEVHLNSFIRGSRCPRCISRKIHPKDSLGQYIIDIYGKEFLEKIWSDKNIKSAFKYAPQCNKKAWFKCPIGKHEDHEMKIQNATLRDYRCPQCTKERTESLIEEKTRLYLESLGYTILHEYNCTIKPRNPKTNTIMPFDNEIKELKLIIEVHGKQHYMSDFYDYRYSKEEGKYLLHQRQLYDRYKKIYAIQNDYEYLELNWKIFDKKDTYKQMIDDKIKEILNKNY